MGLEQLFELGKLVLCAVGMICVAYIIYHSWFYVETEEDLINHSLDRIGRYKAAQLAERILASPNPVQLACEYEYKQQEDAQVRIEYAQRKNDLNRNDDQPHRQETING